MGTKLESLQEKMSRLQSQIATEEAKEATDAAIAVVRDSFSDAILKAIAATEKRTNKSLTEIGLGIWVAYAPNGPTDAKPLVSALEVGDDGLPKQLRRPRNGTSNGASNGNGNGHYEYVLADGTVFDSCEKAVVAATGEPIRDENDDMLAGKMYWYRHDRLPKELAEAITKREKTEDGASQESAQAA